MRCLQAVMTDLSIQYRLNPFQNKYEHEARTIRQEYVPTPPPVLHALRQAWASVEGNLHRALAAYCMTRFQRNRGVRQDSTHACVHYARSWKCAGTHCLFCRSAKCTKMSQLKMIIREKLKDFTACMANTQARVHGWIWTRVE